MADRFERYDAFIAALTERLSQEPSIALNPHCLSESKVYHLIGEISPRGVGPESSKSRTLAWLQEIGLLTPIVMDEYPDGSTRGTRFYRLDLARKARSQPSPLELLQAADANGVICYFTAVAFHSLTTQPPAYHHIATLINPKSKTAATPPKTTAAVPAPPRKEPDPLGEWLFTYSGLRYYRTSRERRLIPGVQTRFLGPETLVRITTLEQTLLDTLHRPLSCGGPAVVMEAWEQGIGRANQAKLVSHLQAMDHRPTAQRLGYLLERIGYKLSPELSGVIAGYLSQLDPDDPAAPQQLFPGVRYEHLEYPWLIYGPS